MPTACSARLVLEQSHFDRPQETGVLALMVNKDFVAFAVVKVLRLGEVSVRVAAQNDVKPCGIGDEVWIHIGLVAPTEMTKANDDVASLLASQSVDDGLSRLCRACVTHALVVPSRDEPLRLWADAEDTHTHACTLQNNVGFDQTLARRACEVVVAADEGELRHSHQAGKVIEPEVELMVADGTGIVTHEVHQPNLHFTLVEIIVNGALAEVAAIEQKHIVGMLSAHLFEEDDAPHIAALVGLSRVAEVRRDRLNAGMRVARMNQKEQTLWRPPYPL